MAPPKSTLWKIEPHTIGKHLVLRSYLDAWLPIMSSRNTRILFIDGFAGPGEYEGGKEGSPQIAIQALLNHSAEIECEVVYFFIEKDKNRADHLEKVVNGLSKKGFKVKLSVVNGTFDETMTSIFEYLDDQKIHMAPAFVMIDPFGVAGTPMRAIERIMQNPRCEVYFSFDVRVDKSI